MTIKESIRKYAQKLNEVTHIPSKEIEILIMYLLEKNVIWMHLNGDLEFLQQQGLNHSSPPPPQRP